MGRLLRTKGADASLAVGNGDRAVKSRFLLFPLSNKTMALHRLIKWVIEGVRALPSAPNIALLSLVLRLTL